MGTFTRGPMWLQLAQHLLLFWLIHYSDATPFKELTTELADPSTLGCYYNYNHYSEGDRILTNEPCLNCTCHNKMLMCYLRVCPFTKPIGQDCTIEKREDQCCPIITCPEVPVELVDHSSGLHSTSLAMPDRYGCHINNQYYAEGSQIPSNPKKPCELCYCIRNMTSCVMQECTLHVEGCSPIYNRDVCCPVRYDCGRDSIDEELLLEESTTTVRPTPGFMLTTTMVPDQNHCVHNDEIYAEGEVISTDQPCEHCYCMRGDIVCAVQECSAQLENRGKHCKPRPPQIGQCCPDTYDCDIEGETTEESLSLTTTSPSISTESDNINEIEDDGLTKPLPITEHIDEFDKTTIASIGQRFDASGESSTQSILKDLHKLQDKLEVTTMLYSAFDEDIDMNTVVPFKIPGEGSCLIDGVTYTNSTKIPVTNKCDKSCVCLNSLPQCIPIECDEPAATSNCKLIQNDDNLCCPVYDCAPAVTATEAAVSETERSTEAFTETPTGVTKSLDFENVTELTGELATEKEPTGTEQPEEPSTSEKISESVQEATTQPSVATEDKVTTQVAVPEEGELATVTATPLETAKTQKTLTAEQGTQPPTEESTKLPVDEEIAVTQKAYTVGEPTEGISEVTTIEPSASTEQSTEVSEEISSEVPDVLGTRGGEIEVHAPADSHVTPTEKIEGETSTLSQEELIPITEKAITPTKVQPEETASEAIEGSGTTEETISSTQKPLAEEEQTEVSENITEKGTTAAPSEEGSTRKPIPSTDVTEKTSPEEEQTEEITGKGTTSAPSEEGSTSKPIPSGDVTEKTLPEEEQTEEITEKGATSAPSEEGSTRKPIPIGEVTEKTLPEEGQTEEIIEQGTTSAPSEEGSTRKLTPSADVTETTLPGESVTEAEEGSGATEPSVAETQKPIPEESQTEVPESITEKGATSAPSEEGLTGKPIPSAGVTEKALPEEITEEGATSAPSEEDSTRKPIPSVEVTEKTLPEEGQTEEIIEQGTTSAPSEEGSTRRPIPTEKTEEPAEGGATETSLPTTKTPISDEGKTEVPENITEQATVSAVPEEETTKEPGEATEKTIVASQKIPAESVTEPAEDTGITQESIVATEKPLPEGDQTEGPETISEKRTTSAPLEEGTTIKSHPGEVQPVKDQDENIIFTESPTEEISSDLPDILGTRGGEIEVHTTAQGIIPIESHVTQEVPTSEVTEKEATTLTPSVVGEEGATEKPISPIPIESHVTQEVPTSDVTEKEATTLTPSIVGEEGATEKPVSPIRDYGITQVSPTEKSPQEEEVPTEGSVTEASVKPSYDEVHTEISGDVTEKATTLSGIEEGTVKASTLSEGEINITEKPITATHVVPQEAARKPVEIGGATEESILSTKTPLSEEVFTESPVAATEKVTSEPSPSEELTEKPIIPTQVLPQETVTESAETTGATETSVSATEVAEGITEEGTTSTALEEGTIKFSPSEVAVTEQTIGKIPEVSVTQPAEGATEKTATEKPLFEESQTGAPETITEKGTTLTTLEEGTTKESRPSEGVTEKILPEEAVSESAEGTTAGEGVAVTREPVFAEEHTESITEKSTSAVLEEGTTKPSQPSDVESEPLIEKYITKAADTTEKATTAPIEGIEDLTTTQKSEIPEEASEVPDILGTRGGEIEAHTTAPGTIPIESHVTEEAPTSEIVTSTPSIIEIRPSEGVTAPEESTSEAAESSGATEASVVSTQKPLSGEEQPEEITEKGATSAPSEEGSTVKSIPSIDVTEKALPEEEQTEEITEKGATSAPSEEGSTRKPIPSIDVTEKALPEEEQTEEITEKGATSAPEVGSTRAPISVTDVTEEILPGKSVTEAEEGSGATEPSVAETQKPISEISQTEVAETATEKGATSAPSEEGSTGKPISSAEVTEKTLPEEEQTEEITEKGATSAPSEKGSTVKSIPSAGVTEKTLPEEEQTEEITEKGATSAPSEEGSTRKPIPSTDVTEKTLPEEEQTEEITEKGATSAPEEGSTRKPISIADVTEKTLPGESVTEAEEGSGGTEPSIAETQKPTSEESQTEVPEAVTEKGATSAPSEEGLTGKPIPSAGVTEKVLPGESVTEAEEGSGGTEPSIAETQKPTSEESQTEVPEAVTEKGATSAPSEEGSTRKPVPIAEVTEKTLPEEEQTEEITEKGATSAPSEEGSTRKPVPSAGVTEKTLPEEEQTEEITEKGATSAPSEEGSTRKPIPSEAATEKALPEEPLTEAEEGSGATEPSFAETQKPISEGSPTEVPESITEKGTTSAPSEEGSTRKPAPSAEVTEKTLPEEEQTEEITEKGATSAPSEEGSTRKPVPSAGVTEKTLPEEEQTEETTETGSTAAPSEEGSTRKPIPSAGVTEKALPEESVTEAEEGSGATEPSVAKTQKPIFEESQTEVPETITEKGATSAPSEEGLTGKPVPSADVTEKPLPEEEQIEEITEKGATSAPSEEGSTSKPILSAGVTEKVLPGESVTEAEEGSGATEPSVVVTQKPTFDESQTEISENITEKDTTLASLEEGTTKQSIPSERITEKATPQEPEPTEGSGATEKPVSVTEPSTEVQTESTEKATTASSLEESRTTILDIISPPQTIVPQKIEDITQPSIEAVTSTSEPEISSEAPIGSDKVTESEAEVTKTVPSTESELAATEKTERPEGPKESESIEQETQKGTEASATTQASAELGATEVTEKELEISSEIPEILGTRYGEIEAHTTSKGIIPIESHVTEEASTEEEAAASTPSTIGEEGATEKPISPIRGDAVTTTEISATLQPSQEEVQTEISTDRSTTISSVPSIHIVSGEDSEVIEEPIEQIHIEPQEATREPVTEEIVSSTQIPLSEEGQTAAPENITEQGTTLATPEELVTKESLPIDVTQESASEPAEVSGATEESASPTQKPLSEEARTEVPEGITEKGTTSSELEGTTKESRPSDIGTEKVAEGSTVSSVEVGEKFGGDLTTETQKITTIFDIISPPQTTVPQPAEVSDLTTTQRSLTSEEERTSVPTGSSEEPITEGVTKAAGPLLTEGIEKTEEPLLQGVTEETSSAVEDLTSQKVDLTTVSPPSDEGFQTEKAVTAGQVPTETEPVSTEKGAEGVTETTEPSKPIKGQPAITDSPIVSTTQEADKESEKIFDENVTFAAEGTTLSGIDFEQKFGEDNKTESLPGKMTTILDIIFPTKAPIPIVQHEEVEQTTVALEEESEKDIGLTTEKLAVTEKEYISTKAPSVDQTTYKPTVTSSSETPSGQYDNGYEPGTSHYPGQTYLEEDYGDEEDQTAFGPGTCRYGGKLYVSAQQIPRDDPCDFCFCFRSDIICLQQSCPPPINGCHEEPIQGFCCPRYECPVSMATVVNMTTSTTTTSTTLPPHFLHHAYKGAATKSGCQIDEHTYQVGDMVPSASGPCIHCICGGDGQMKCDPKQCTPEPMLRQMIAITSRR